ncbi:Hypothetical protein NTJ_06553 [Nesidiocoris tenuis]|uniref:Uncharacterized protein n=1 Tax=Nesidiocoris tenuis TaxID=355587 RepID=A0ABN7AP54_9HEMI|nr:Hypothetical protein NTJ_06553 [Nesidiocoris tenuis]
MPRLHTLACSLNQREDGKGSLLLSWNSISFQLALIAVSVLLRPSVYQHLRLARSFSLQHADLSEPEAPVCLPESAGGRLGSANIVAPVGCHSSSVIACSCRFLGGCT